MHTVSMLFVTLYYSLGGDLVDDMLLHLEVLGGDHVDDTLIGMRWVTG